MPSDWEPRPVYPIHHIPYHVAQYWDHGLREQVEDKTTMARQRKTSGQGKGRVPRELRETIKKTPGVKGWVRTLEGPVRQFLIDQGEAQDSKDESDFSDEEIVFVGRKAAPREGWTKAHREEQDHAIDRGIIYDSLEDGESGAFKYVLCLYSETDMTSRCTCGSLTVRQAIPHTFDIQLLWPRLTLSKHGKSVTTLCLHWHSSGGCAQGRSSIRGASAAFVGAFLKLWILFANPASNNRIIDGRRNTSDSCLTLIESVCQRYRGLVWGIQHGHNALRILPL